jgi:hypothetical protein
LEIWRKIVDYKKLEQELKTYKENKKEVEILNKKRKYDPLKIFISGSVISFSCIFLYFSALDLKTQLLASIYFSNVVFAPLLLMIYAVFSHFKRKKLKNKNLIKRFFTKNETIKIRDYETQESEQMKKVDINYQEILSLLGKKSNELLVKDIIQYRLYKSYKKESYGFTKEELLNPALEDYVLSCGSEVIEELYGLVLYEKITAMSKETFINEKPLLMKKIKEHCSEINQEKILNRIMQYTEKYYAEDNVSEKIKEKLKAIEDIDKEYKKKEKIDEDFKIKKKNVVIQEI